MYKIIIIPLFSFFFLLSSDYILAQNPVLRFNNRINSQFFSESLDFNNNQYQFLNRDTFAVNLFITDTLITIKELKTKSKYAIKINLEISIQNLQDSLLFYRFNKYVSSPLYINDFASFERFLKKNSVGLGYIIEDTNYHVKETTLEFVSYARMKDAIKNANNRIFISSKQKIERMQLSDQEQREYDLAKYVIHSEKQSLELYPLLDEYHPNLPKGEYYLYLVYSNYNTHVPPPEMRVEGTLDAGNVFRGYFVSNKVKLIVE